MSDNNKDFSAQQLIEKLGGIRPLAKRLGLTPSTVQGWKQRDSIPDNRLKDVLEIAEQEGVDIYEAFVDNKDVQADEDSAGAHSNMKAEQYVAQGMQIQIPDDRRGGERRGSERRAGQDRRHKTDSNYQGTERRAGAQRRTGIDRRHFANRRSRQVIWKTKWNFVERTVMSLSVIYMLATAAFIFLMGPEYQAFMKRQEQVDALEKRLATMGLQLADIQKGKPGTFGGRLSTRIESFQGKLDAIGKLSDLAVGGRIENLERKYKGLSSVISTVQTLRESPEDTSIAELQAAVQGLRGDVDRIDGEVSGSKGENQEITKILQDVSKHDVGAAAMLLALGQFRDSVGSENPFGEDLGLIRELVGDSPELNSALDQLLPYAESGVLTPGTLKSEFGDLATEIVAAGLMGEDLSMGERAAKHFGEFVTVTKDGKRVLQPNHPIAKIVNTAHHQVVTGDIRGAVRTLQKLEGPAAKSAELWVRKARGAILAGNVNTKISKSILDRVSSGRRLRVDSLEGFIQQNVIQPLGIPQNRGLNLKWDPTKNRSQQQILKFN